MNIRRRLAYAVIALLLVTAMAVFGYRMLGHNVSLLQAVYMAIITLAGVGYGEIVDTSQAPALRVFNIFVVLVGVTMMVYVFSVVTAFLVEGEITDIFRRRKMLKRISELKQHYIVCGLGDTGRHAVEELEKTGTPYVVIDAHEENIRRMQEHGAVYKEMLSIVGDATDEAVLDDAGLARAKGLIAALGGDKDNLVVTVMTRQKNSKVRIVARCTDLKYSERMLKAGANSTVSPNHIGGLRMASEVLRPHVVGFLDMMLKEKSRTLRIEELEVPAGSGWVGRPLGELHLRAVYNLMPLAVKQAASGEGFAINPPDDTKLQEGMVVILMGDVADLKRARQEAEKKPLVARI